jgi:hypothetical protein
MTYLLSLPRNDFYASGEGGGYLVKGLKGAKNWGKNPLQNLFFPLMIGIYIHVMEGQREAKPPLYN